MVGYLLQKHHLGIQQLIWIFNTSFRYSTPHLGIQSTPHLGIQKFYLGISYNKFHLDIQRLIWIFNDSFGYSTTHFWVFNTFHLYMCSTSYFWYIYIYIQQNI